MTGLVLSALAAALLLAPPGAPAPAPAPKPPGGTVVDEVVAVVGTRAGEARVITLSTVAEEGRIALVSRGGTEAAFAPLDGAVLRASLDWYVDQLLLHEEAVRLQVFEVDSAAVQAELARFRKEFRRPGDFQAFLYAIDATEEELSAILRRTLRVRRYLESRLGRLRASPAEVEAWYRANPEAVAGRSLDEVSDDIAARLATARADAETRALLAELRSRADIRILVDLGARR
ncbi:MAG TPA: hypothetical protein VFM53_08795 [Anaeromyxobacteraceae bacterium]|nr:hypothetical protein [Anaeromyxobacteraceae bacterium]